MDDRACAHHRVLPNAGPRKQDRPDTDVDSLAEHHPAEAGLAGVLGEACVVGDDRHIWSERDVIVDGDEPRVQLVDIDRTRDVRAHPELKTLSDESLQVGVAPQPVHDTTPDAC